MNRKGFAPLFIVEIIAIIAVAGAGIWYFAAHKNSPSGTVACTQEAKQCLDGSYVGRTGPNCEFAACPAVSSTTDTSGWKTYTNQQYGFSVNYPSDWKTEMMSSYDHNGNVTIPQSVFWFTDLQNLYRLTVAPLGGAAYSNNTSTQTEAFHVGSSVARRRDFSDEGGIYGIIVDQFSNRQYPNFEILISTVNARDNIASSDIAEFDQILSTFSFLPPTSSSTTTTSSTARGTGAFCGGIAAGAFQCSLGYTCILKGTYPDAGGTCQIQKVMIPPGVMCAQHVVTAKNTATGEVHDFPTPCQVPEGWVAVR
jgi:hypothetical protein